MIIGISGMPAAGKDTVSEYLEQKEGYNHISLSEILRGIVKAEGMEVNLENLTKAGNLLTREYNNHYLAQKAMQRVRRGRNTVISSIRQPGEIEYLRSRKDFYMVFVDADIKIRFERLKLRDREGDSKTLKEFRQIEKKQLDGKDGGMNLLECKKKSDFVLTNDGTMEEFIKKIKDLVKKLNERERKKIGK